MGCKVIRKDNGEVETVLAFNGQESKLYSSIMRLPSIQMEPELGVDLFFLAYTPSFKSYFGDFENGEQKGMVDENGEPFLVSLLNFISVPADEVIEAVKSEEEPKPVMYQLSSEEQEAANKELDKYLLDFLKAFGVQSKEFESLKERLGVDALGATDVLNKLIWYAKDRRIDTIPEEAGHMIVMLMGEEHPDIKALLTEITGWTEYSKIYQQYYPIYKNEKQVQIEAVGKLLAQALVGNYKKYGTNKDLIQRALEIIDKIIKKILETLNLVEAANYPFHIADKVALNVLSGNKKFIANITNTKQQLDYQKALENNPFAQSIIKTFTDPKGKFKFKLTGSLGIAAQGENVYRPSEEPIHDLDFVVDNIEDANDLLNFLEDNNFEPVHSGWKHSNYVTYAYYLTPPGYSLRVTKRSASGWAEQLELRDINGNIVPITKENVIAADFFVYYDKVKNTNPEMYAKWQDIYAGKMGLSPLKENERMFQRPKDQEDYVRSRPSDMSMSLPQFVYFQLSDETKSFKSYAMKQANDLQKKVLNDLYYEPKPGESDPGRIILEPENHVYIHTLTGQQYKSVTTAIKGGMADPENFYELNRLFGNEFDTTLQNIIMGKSFEEAKADMTGILSEEISREAYSALKGFIIGLTSDGSIVLPQVVLGDPQSGIAGSLDLFVLKPDGSVRIIDLKVSKNSWKSPAYRTPYKTNEGSMFPDEEFTTMQQHNIQVAAYKRLAEINGYQVDGISTVHIHLKLNDKLGDLLNRSRKEMTDASIQAAKEGKSEEEVKQIMKEIKDRFEEDRKKLGQEKEVLGFQWEEQQDHLPTANETFVNRMIPTRSDADKIAGFKKELGLNNPANDPDFLTAEEARPEANVSDETIKNLHYTIDFYVDKLRQRLDYLKNLNKTRFSTFSEFSRDQAIDRVSELLTSIETLKAGSPSQAFGKLLSYTKETLDNIYRYIADPANVDKEEYVDIIMEAEKFVEAYRGLAEVPELALGSPEQQRMMRDILSRLNAVKSEINPSLEAYVKNLIMQKTTDKNLTEEELTTILREGYDINLDELAFSDMQNTKERLLAIAANLYQEAAQKAMNRTDEWAPKIRAVANKLASLLGVKKIDFSFMLNYDKEGNFTGRYLEPIGEAYYNLKRKMFNLLKDKNGENMKYVEIGDLSKADPADIEFNKKLFELKNQVREFSSAERLVDGKIVSGEYHEFTEEFIRERAKYEEPDAYQLAYGNLRWRKRAGVSEEAYRKFKDKYYDRVEYVKAEMDRGVYNGRAKRDVGYFPKRKHVKVKEITSTGEDMRDPRYKKLMNPTNSIEQAQKEFYELFTTTMKDFLSKLPVDVQAKMLGSVARVKDNFVNTAKKKGTGMFKAFTKTVRDWFDFSPKLHSMQRLTDDDGVTVDNLPILYTNDARNEKKINTLKEKIKDLKDEYMVKKSITREEYEPKLKNLEMALAIENSKISFNEINLDLAENLIAFGMMAEKYEQMSDIESSLLAIAKIVEKKKYYNTNTLNEKLVRKADKTKDIYKAEGESNSYKRFKKWFKMVYYNNDEYDYSTFAEVARKMQNITSIKGMGLNPFSGVNNYVMGRINNAIEAYGGQFFERKAYFRATKEYNKDYLPGVMSGIGKGAEGPYLTRKPNSKYEAMVQYFRMVRKFQTEEGKVDLLSALYVFQEAGEYNVQSKTGIGVIMSTNKFYLTNKNTGETVAIYDAFDFNASTGELKLLDGFEIPEEMKFNVTNYIYEVNKHIHGNYAWEDRMVIQSHVLGQLAAQFHKWIYPLWRARFGKRKDYEILGTVEGRYKTFWNVMKHIYQTEQGFLAKTGGMLKALFAPGTMKGSLDEYQVANMYKNLAELSFFLAAVIMQHIFMLLASGLDDDDEEAKKFMNFLIYQQTRQQNEIKQFIPIFGFKEQYQLVKNPLAMTGTMRDYGEATASIVSMPFPPYDKNYYERGPHKGGLKAWKEVKDIVPALNMLNRWESFETVKSFYIK